MAIDTQTARIEYEYSCGWAANNPPLAADSVLKDIQEIQASNMTLRFDFSRAGFFKVIGFRPENTPT